MAVYVKYLIILTLVSWCHIVNYLKINKLQKLYGTKC